VSFHWGDEQLHPHRVSDALLYALGVDPYADRRFGTEGLEGLAETVEGLIAARRDAALQGVLAELRRRELPSWAAPMLQAWEDADRELVFLERLQAVVAGCRERGVTLEWFGD